MLRSVLENPVIPDFRKLAIPWGVAKASVDFNKLACDVILDTWTWKWFVRNMDLDWDHSIVIKYDWVWAHALSFDLDDDWKLVVNQIQWSNSKYWYKVWVSLQVVRFYVEFFKLNVLWNISWFEVVKQPKWLDDDSIVLKWDPIAKYRDFEKTILIALEKMKEWKSE